MDVVPVVVRAAFPVPARPGRAPGLDPTRTDGREATSASTAARHPAPIAGHAQGRAQGRTRAVAVEAGQATGRATTDGTDSSDPTTTTAERTTSHASRTTRTTGVAAISKTGTGSITTTRSTDLITDVAGSRTTGETIRITVDACRTTAIVAGSSETTRDIATIGTVAISGTGDRFRGTGTAREVTRPIR